MIINRVDDTYLVNKPTGWTSFDVVAKIRNQLKKETNHRIKVGHTGTLDPFATGLLIILTGQETKKQAEFMKLDKEYQATLQFGATSTTDDLEGEVTPSSKRALPISESALLKSIKKYLGVIEQMPPNYSAIKIKGKPAYQLARAGKPVELKPRQVTISDIEILNYNWPILKLRIECSSGTYIRSLARDIGKDLGCGAYLLALTRTKIGNYSLDKAKELTELVS